jgi:hypothetical protein
MIVEPFRAAVLRVTPERRSGRRQAAFEVAVDNGGNDVIELELAARDAEDSCPIELTPPRIAVPRGASAQAALTVKAPRRMIFGRAPVDHLIEVSAKDTDDVPRRQVTFRQRPWLPWWVPTVTIAAIAALVAALMLLGRDPEVPNLIGHTAHEAREELDQHGFVLGRATNKTDPDATPGTIVSQIPASDEPLAEGGAVRVEIARGERLREVPKVTDRTLAEAIARLEEREFGVDAPADAADDATVTRQLPSAGQRRQTGTTVRLTVAAATDNDANNPQPTSSPPGAGADQPGPGEAAPPRPADLVFIDAQDEAGAGQLYRLTRTAREPRNLTPGERRLDAPAWLSGGSIVAVELLGDNREDNRRQLVRIGPRGRIDKEPLTWEGAYHRPDFSQPRDRLAVINADQSQEAVKGSGKLCAMRIQTTANPPCAPAPPDGQTVGRPVWSPRGGGEILALAAFPREPYSELVIYDAAGDNPQDWRARRIYRAAEIRSADWRDHDTIVVLAKTRPGQQARLLELRRTADGSFSKARELADITGCELTASGSILAVHQGDCTGNGEIVLVDLQADEPREHVIAGVTGTDPAWRPPG